MNNDHQKIGKESPEQERDRLRDEMEAIVAAVSHSPAPWEVNAEGGPNLLLIYEEGTENCIAEVFGGVNGDPKANARLIAAAPELLSALRLARIHVEAICEHNERLNGGESSREDRMDLLCIDDAIEKAAQP